MLTFPEISPVFLEIGPIAFRWYGLMYAVSILLAWHLLRTNQRNRELTEEQVDSLLTYVALGVILGGRLGYFLFYAPHYFLENPLYIIQLYHPGMAFHGGLLGVMFSVYLFSRVHKVTFLKVIDLIAITVPIGLGLGRIGNFINGELWGRITDVPWAMVFPNSDNMPRHPSQLYEAGLEGLLLFVILWSYAKKPRKAGVLSAIFLVGYSISRGFVEFFREPDLQYGLLLGKLTMGQLLSLPMLFLGIILLFWSLKQKD